MKGLTALAGPEPSLPGETYHLRLTADSVKGSQETCHWPLMR